MLCFFFFFRQKTAYDMRISDWSSDVCSSDLAAVIAFPASVGDESHYRDAIASIRAGEAVPTATLTDRDLATTTETTPTTPLVVTMKAPFTARAVTVYSAHDAAFSAPVAASDDGPRWRPVGKVSVAARTCVVRGKRVAVGIDPG